jgi:hypothetical protein
MLPCIAVIAQTEWPGRKGVFYCEGNALPCIGEIGANFPIANIPGPVFPSIQAIAAFSN